MMGRVTVADRLYEQQGTKVVTTAGGQVRHLPPGQVPEPQEDVLAKLGEPSFAVHLATQVRTDEDVSDEVGLALRRVGRRLHDVMPDGQEDPDGAGPVEGVFGPAVRDGAVVICLDTDGAGAGPSMMSAMAAIFVEELTPLGVDAHVAAGPSFSDAMLSGWMSTEERRRG
jgi:hypothetical protein